MGSMYRSDKMSLCEFFIQTETAYESLTRLGHLCCVQFNDMNEAAANMREFVSEVCRCEEMMRRLRFMYVEMVKDDIFVPEMSQPPTPMLPHDMLNYEAVLEKWETDLIEMSSNLTIMMKGYMELSEMHYVLTNIGPILGNAEIHLSQTVHSELQKEGHLAVMTGVVNRDRSFPFQVMLWRISKGNIFYKEANEDRVIYDPTTRQGMRKVAFLLICQGEQLTIRTKKVCTGFRANLYPCPRTAPERDEMSAKLDVRLRDMEKVIKKTKYQRCKALRTVASVWRDWHCSVKMSKAIFYQLNLFTLDITRKCFIGQGWVPDDDISAVQEVLTESAKAAESPAPSFVSMIDTFETPPTYHRTNKFTRGFQNLINAYGDSTYRELNPGLYTVVTFPFLFAMMFGDVGHAFIMVCFALYMVLNEKTFDNQRSTNEIWNIFYAGRYIILLMGIFSMYTGFLYNDCFSKRMYLAKSQWLENLESKSDEKYTGAGDYEFDPTLDATQFAYPIGIDPVWGVAKNKIVVENSLKMKLSIIIGVVHMLFGLSLGLFNHLYFKQYYKIFLELIPQVTFLTCLFAYLVFMMYFKWFMFSGIEDGHITGNADSMKQGAGCAPLILIYFIDMVLLSKTKPVEEECDAYMYKGQQTVQMTLLFIGLLCIPIMLLGVPCFVHMKNKKTKTKLPEKSQFRRYRRRTGERDSVLNAKKQDHDEGESMGELMTHQSVHTIEFVLSTISHTASYLRLWALSLAHAQLSEMLWTMVLAQVGLHKKGVMGIIMTWLMFYAWAVLTLSIMVLMEGLSAFLHTLRLHWVEFMSKFYGGGGHKFIPFCFKGMCFSEEEEKPSAVCGKLTRKTKTG